MEIEKLLSKYPYADMRAESASRETVKIIDDEIKVSEGTARGISVRVLYDNAWGFASSNSVPFSADGISVLLRKAEKIARIEKGNVRIGGPQQEKKTANSDFSLLGMEEKIGVLKDASKLIKGDGIKGKNLSYVESIVESEFYNSSGSEIRQKAGYSYVNFTAISQKGENMQRASERQSSISGFGKLDIYGKASEAKEKALRLLDAKLPPKGRFAVIMDSEMTGVFSHEALGHACEADSIIDRESILHGKLGEKIGSDLVSIVDNPEADDFGHYAYDEEGIKSQKAPLVEKGVLKGYLNSLETAEKLSMAKNGHARAMGYDSFPIVRMSNTYFMPGKSSLEEVFDARRAIYVKGMKGGSVDIFSGGFMFKAEEGYEVIDGEKKTYLRDITLSGNVIETLYNVEAVGRDFATSPGFCGKFGQDVPVSDGGPHIRVSSLMVG